MTVVEIRRAHEPVSAGRPLGRLGGVGRQALARAWRGATCSSPRSAFNCERACGLLAYVDRETLEVKKFEGNPAHPGSRRQTVPRGRPRTTRPTTPSASSTRSSAWSEWRGKWKRVTWEGR